MAMILDGSTRAPQPRGLTSTEQAVLKYAQRGLLPEEIEDALDLAEGVFRYASQAILTLFGWSSLAQAVPLALFGGNPLTHRQLEVLSLIAEGNSSKQAANALYVSKRTVDFHLGDIYDLLDVRNRMQAIRLMDQNGWTLPHPDVVRALNAPPEPEKPQGRLPDSMRLAVQVA